MQQRKSDKGERHRQERLGLIFVEIIWFLLVGCQTSELWSLEINLLLVPLDETRRLIRALVYQSLPEP